MAWTNPPRTWATAEVITQSLLNTHLRDQLLALEFPIQRDTTDKTVTNTVTETSLFNSAPSIAANTVGANGKIYAEVFGSITGNAAATLTLRVKLGGTTIVTPVSAVAVQASTMKFRLLIDIFNRGATNSQYGNAICLVSQTDNLIKSADGTAAVDTTAAQTFDVTAQWGTATAAVSITASARLVRASQLT